MSENSSIPQTKIEETHAAGRRPSTLELTQEAIQPAHVRVNKTDGTGVDIDWKDGHKSHWSFEWLRAACPCAGCVKDREATGRAPGELMPQPSTALPILKPQPNPSRVRPVGRYAVGFDWNDGHRSGIYSWYYLRSVCQCPECTAARKTAKSA
jgi:DUF971 family protein